MARADIDNIQLTNNDLTQTPGLGKVVKDVSGSGLTGWEPINQTVATTVELDTLVGDQVGDFVFNQEENAIYVWDGSDWQPIGKPDHQLFDTGAGTPNDLSLDPANGLEAIEVDRSDPVNPCVIANWHWDDTSSKWMDKCLDPLPTASVYVAPGQPCDAVDVNLGYAKSDDCALPGGQTAGPWTLKNGLGAVIASGDDLEGLITLPNLCSEPLPFEFSYQVTDACGTSFPAESFGFSPAPAIPTATVLVDPNQWCGGVGITLGYAANPSCSTPGQTAGSWVIKDNLGATVASGTDLAGALPPQDLCAETGPFTLEATVTDGCGTSATVIEPFATVPALPTAGIGAIASGQPCDNFQFDLTHTPDPACPSGTQLTGAWSIKTSPGGVTLASGTDLASASPITAPDLCANTGEDLVIEYQTSDSCGTSPVATSPTFQVVPAITSKQIPILIGDGSCELIVPSTCPSISCNNLNPNPVIIDNGEAGFSFTPITGNWINFPGSGSNLGYEGTDSTNKDYHYVENTNRGEDFSTASWTFSGLTPGTYEVAMTWDSFGNYATNAPVNAYDGATLLSSTTVSQNVQPTADYTEGGEPFEIIFASVTITGTELRIEITNEGGNQFVIADAVRIVELTFTGNVNAVLNYGYNGVEQYLDVPSFEAAIIANEPTTTAEILCVGGQLVLEVDASYPDDAFHVDAAVPAAGLSIVPNQGQYNVDVGLEYSEPNGQCQTPGQAAGSWRVLQGGSPLVPPFEGGPNEFGGSVVNLNLDSYVNGGDVRNASYPADFLFDFEYTVTNNCGGTDTVTQPLNVTPELKDPYIYIGPVTQTVVSAPAWAGSVSALGCKVTAWGAAGAGSFFTGTFSPIHPGGGGGFAVAEYDALALPFDTIVVGEGGKESANGGSTVGTYGGGGIGGPSVPSGGIYEGGSGGGLTGVFLGGFAHANSVLIAGGGGASGGGTVVGAGSFGGSGGGAVGGDAGPNQESPTPGGYGGTTDNGGLGPTGTGGLGSPDSNSINPGTDGAALQGGDGGIDTFNFGGGGGGGGGYYGGGGGGGHELGSIDRDSGGGGGSGFISGTNASLVAASGAIPGNDTDYDFVTFGLPQTPPAATGQAPDDGGDGLLVITWNI